MILKELLTRLPKKKYVSIDNGKDYSYVDAWGRDLMVRDVLKSDNKRLLESDVIRCINNTKAYITINYNKELN